MTAPTSAQYLLAACSLDAAADRFAASAKEATEAGDLVKAMSYTSSALRCHETAESMFEWAAEAAVTA